jgi:hypothetical protein
VRPWDLEIKIFFLPLRRAWGKIPSRAGKEPTDLPYGKAETDGDGESSRVVKQRRTIGMERQRLMMGAKDDGEVRTVQSKGQHRLDF